METENAGIQESDFSKQCVSEEVIEVSSSPSPIDSDINSIIFGNFTAESIKNEPEPFFVKSEPEGVQEEPIDLTFERNDSFEKELIKKEPILQTPTRIIIQSKPESRLINRNDPLLSGRGHKRKYEVPDTLSNEEFYIANWNENIGQSILPRTLVIPENSQRSSDHSYTVIRPQQHQQVLAQHITDKQQEILKMAKSIFSKRTRTLYHWMYPTASKQQIKQVVSSTWDSMAAQEKNIYINQVLGRFGYANANLMVNPQLGQIKDLPPAREMYHFNPKTTELQNAISSITNETDDIQESCGSSGAHKKLRISKRKIAQSLTSACQEFDDDPELSKELAQFSMMFKNQF